MTNVGSELDKRRFKIEIRTFWVLCFYALCTFIQVWLTGDALNTAKSQFEMDQRPYIEVSASDESHKFDIVITDSTTMPGHVDIRVPYRNYGKSPAIIQGFSVFVSVGENAAYKIGPAPMLKSYDSQSVLPPGMDNFMPFPSPGHASQNDPPGQIAVFLRIKYRSLTQHLYESDICFMNTAPSEPRTYCPAELGLNKLLDCEKDKCDI